MDDNNIDMGRAGERRVHGFAEGDRVSIVDCEYAGAYGKVVAVSGGCPWNSTCLPDCYLVYVDLLSRPKGIVPTYLRNIPSYMLTDDGPQLTFGVNAFRFRVHEVTHLD